MMTRLDYERLEAWKQACEQSKPKDCHFAPCADCQEVLRKIYRIITEYPDEE